MIVVCDTGPLRYLVEIDIIDSLHALYGEVLTTPEVIRELGLSHFPEPVRRWATQVPGWVRVESPRVVRFMDALDQGEASAISLACERSADLILMDERDGTQFARNLGFDVYGTLAVIAQAAAQDIADFEELIRRLTTQTRFNHTPQVIERTRARYQELRSSRRG